MWKLPFRTRFLILPVLAVAFHPGLPAAQDSCFPGYWDVYDYRVGDVFQFQASSATSAGGYWPTKTTDYKFTVLSKEVQGTTRAYRLQGFYRHYEYTTRSPIHRYNQSWGTIDEAWVIEDSASHVLNACPGDSASISFPGAPQAVFSTSVRVATGPVRDFPAAGPTWRLKWIGGQGNLVWKSGTAPMDSVSLHIGYAAGLGMISKVYSYFETSNYEYLQGHVRDGDTVGVVSPDSLFQAPVSTRALPGGSRSGAPARLAGNPARPWKGGYMDLLGRRFRLSAIAPAAPEY